MADTWDDITTNINLTATDEASGPISHLGEVALSAADELQAAAQRASASLDLVAGSGQRAFTGMSGGLDSASKATTSLSDKLDRMAGTISKTDGALSTMRGTAANTAASLSSVADQSVRVYEELGQVADASVDARMGLKSVGDEGEYAASMLARASGGLSELAVMAGRTNVGLDALLGKLDLFGAKLDSMGNQARGTAGANDLLSRSLSNITEATLLLTPEISVVRDAMFAEATAADRAAGANERLAKSQRQVSETRPTGSSASGSEYEHGSAFQARHTGRSLMIGGGLLTGAGLGSVYEFGQFDKGQQTVAGNANLSVPVSNAEERYVLKLFGQGPESYQNIYAAEQRAAETFPQRKGQSNKAYEHEIDAMIKASWESAIGSSGNQGIIAQALALAMHNYRIGAKGAMPTMDVLHSIAAYAGGGTTVETLSGNMGRSSAQAALYGVSIPQWGGLYDVLSKQFGPARTDMYMASLIQHMAAQSTGARGALKKLGMEGEWNQAGLMQRGVYPLLSDLMTALRRKPLAEQGNLLQAIIPATRGGQAFQALMKNGHLAEAESTTQQLGGNLGAGGPVLGTGGGIANVTADMFKRMMERPWVEIETAVNRVKKSIIEIGQVVAPIFGQFASLVVRGADAVAKFAEHHKKLFQTIVEVGAAMAGLGVVIAGLGAVLSGGPILAFAAALLGLGVAFKGSYDHSKTFRTEVNSLVSDVLPTLKQAASDVAAAWPQVHKALEDVATFLVGTFKGAWDQAKSEISFARQAISDVATPLQNLATWLGIGGVKGKDFASGLQSIAGPLGIFAGTFLTIYATIKAALIVWEAIKIATQAWTIAQMLLNVAMDANPIGAIIIVVALLAAGIVYAWNHWKGFHDFVLEAWGRLQQFGAWLTGTLVPAIQKVFTGVIDWLKSNWKTLLVGVLTGPFGLIAALFASGGKDWLGKIASAVTAEAPKIKDALVSAVEKALSAAGDYIQHHNPFDWLSSHMPTLGLGKGGGGFAGSYASGPNNQSPSMATLGFNAPFYDSGQEAGNYQMFSGLGIPYNGALLDWDYATSPHAVRLPPGQYRYGGQYSQKGMGTFEYFNTPNGGDIGFNHLLATPGFKPGQEVKGGTTIGISGEPTSSQFGSGWHLCIVTDESGRAYLKWLTGADMENLSRGQAGGFSGGGGYNGAADPLQTHLGGVQRSAARGSYDPLQAHLGGPVTGHEPRGTSPVSVRVVESVPQMNLGSGRFAGTEALIKQQGYAPYVTNPDQAGKYFAREGSTDIPALAAELKLLPPEIAKPLTSQLGKIAGEWDAAGRTFNTGLATEDTRHQQALQAIHDRYGNREQALLDKYQISDGTAKAGFLLHESANYAKAQEDQRHTLAKYNIDQSSGNETYLAKQSGIYSRASEEQRHLETEAAASRRTEAAAERAGRSTDSAAQHAKRMSADAAAQARREEAIRHQEAVGKQAIASLATTLGISQTKAKAILDEDLRHRQVVSQQAITTLAGELGISRKHAKAMLEEALKTSAGQEALANQKENESHQRHVAGLTQALENHVNSLHIKLSQLGKTIAADLDPSKLWGEVGQQLATNAQKYADTGSALEYALAQGQGKTETTYHPLTAAQRAANRQSEVNGGGPVYQPGAPTTTNLTAQELATAIAGAITTRGQVDDRTLATDKFDAAVDLGSGDLAAFGKDLADQSTIISREGLQRALAGQSYGEQIDTLRALAAQQRTAQTSLDGWDAIVSASTGTLSDMEKAGQSLATDIQGTWERALLDGSQSVGELQQQMILAAQTEADVTNAKNLESAYLGELTGSAAELDSGLKGLLSTASDKISFWTDMVGRAGTVASAAAGSIGQLATTAIAAAQNLGSLPDIIAGLKNTADQTLTAGETEFARTGQISPGTVGAFDAAHGAENSASADKVFADLSMFQSAGDVTDYYKSLGEALPLLAQNVTDTANKFGTASTQYQQAEAAYQNASNEYAGLGTWIQNDGNLTKLHTVTVGESSSAIADNSAKYTQASAAIAAFQSGGITPAEAALRPLTVAIHSTDVTLGQVQTALTTVQGDLTTLGSDALAAGAALGVVATAAYNAAAAQGGSGATGPGTTAAGQHIPGLAGLLYQAGTTGTAAAQYASPTATAGSPAYAQGYEAGSNGQNPTSNPYPVTTQQGYDYAQGVQDGLTAYNSRGTQPTSPTGVAPQIPAVPSSGGTGTDTGTAGAPSLTPVSPVDVQSASNIGGGTTSGLDTPTSSPTLGASGDTAGPVDNTAALAGAYTTDTWQVDTHGKLVRVTPKGTTTRHRPSHINTGNPGLDELVGSLVDNVTGALDATVDGTLGALSSPTDQFAQSVNQFAGSVLTNHQSIVQQRQNAIAHSSQPFYSAPHAPDANDLYAAEQHRLTGVHGTVTVMGHQFDTINGVPQVPASLLTQVVNGQTQTMTGGQFVNGLLAQGSQFLSQYYSGGVSTALPAGANGSDATLGADGRYVAGASGTLSPAQMSWNAELANAAVNPGGLNGWSPVVGPQGPALFQPSTPGGTGGTLDQWGFPLYSPDGTGQYSGLSRGMMETTTSEWPLADIYGTGSFTSAGQQSQSTNYLQQIASSTSTIAANSQSLVNINGFILDNTNPAQTRQTLMQYAQYVQQMVQQAQQLEAASASGQGIGPDWQSLFNHLLATAPAMFGAVPIQ